ncbi:hypothetical protein ACLOJK_025563 [Asimina triloba]
MHMGIVLFVIVEKVVRYVEENSSKVMVGWGSHHHHKSGKLKVDETSSDDASTPLINMKDATDMSSECSLIPGEENFSSEGKNLHETANDVSDEQQCCKRNHSVDNGEDKIHSEAPNTTLTESPSRSGDANGCVKQRASLAGSEPAQSPSSLVFGYLNLFSDGIHNFTDGMALGSAFLLYGSVGGWSRTLFLLAHELPQESPYSVWPTCDDTRYGAYASSAVIKVKIQVSDVYGAYAPSAVIRVKNQVGDFGILVRSGFSVPKALFFNFLSALVALGGTALGFTAGGFIYIAVGGVLPELNNGKASIRSSVIQLTSLILGMAVALCISLVE